MKKTHVMIVRLITLTIETGTATATVALISLILFFTLPTKIYYMTPTFLAAKLYANTVVLIFNNRAQIVQNRSHALHSTMSMDGVNIRQGTTGLSGVGVSMGPSTNFGTQSAFGDGGVQISKSIAVWEDGKTSGDHEVNRTSQPSFLKLEV